MKKRSYSMRYIPLEKHERICATTSELAHLLIKAETTPGLSDYILDEPKYKYKEGERTMETAFSLTANYFDGSKQYWDISRSGKEKEPSISRKVRHAQARESSIETFTLYTEDIYKNSIEWANRKESPIKLNQAVKLDTLKFEIEFLMLMNNQKYTLEKIANELGLSINKTTVVFLRIWLKQRIYWNIKNRPLGRQMILGV